MCVSGTTLTVLLVESPQLDLVGFMLGFLLQPAGPRRRGGGRGEAQSFTISLWNSSTINTHTHTHKSKSFMSAAFLGASSLQSLWRFFICKSHGGSTDATRRRPRRGGAHNILSTRFTT